MLPSVLENYSVFYPCDIIVLYHLVSLMSARTSLEIRTGNSATAYYFIIIIIIISM